MIPSTSNTDELCAKLNITDVEFREKCSKYANKWKKLLVNCNDNEYKKILDGINMPIKSTDVSKEIRKSLFNAKWILYSYYSYDKITTNAARYFGLYCGIILYFHELDELNSGFNTHYKAVEDFTVDEIRPFVRTKP
jgi:hypothetical protein